VNHAAAPVMSSAAATSPALVKQHVIDPEICIRCGTCEATCTQGAVSHDDVNYVVAADKCNFCMDCIAPCPTGSIDNWRVVKAPYSLEEQLSWAELPAQEDFGESSSAVIEAIEIDVGSLLEKAHAGAPANPSHQPPLRNRASTSSAGPSRPSRLCSATTA